MPHLVSAIIPTYNRAQYLPRAIQSVIDQDYRPIEVIIIDDGSKDNTDNLIPGLKQKLQDAGIETTYIKQPNGGPARARNNGLKLAKGKFIACLDSDDMWKPKFASTMVRLLETYPSAGMVFGGYLCIDSDDKLTGERPSGLPPQPVEALFRKPFPAVMNYMPTGTPCIMLRTEVIQQVGVFDTDLHIGEDWDLWYRIGKIFDYAYTLEGMTLVRNHATNMIKSDSRAIGDKIKLILKHLPDLPDGEIRREQIRRMQADMILLQEQLLREKRSRNDFASLLDHQLVPHSKRFKLGKMMLKLPRFIGPAYAAIIRGVGSLQRGAGIRHVDAQIVPSPNLEAISGQ